MSALPTPEGARPMRLHAFELVREQLEAAPLEASAGSLAPKRRAALVRRALYHPDFERTAFSSIAPMLLRLSELTLLQEQVEHANLTPRDKIDIGAELDRTGLRIMLREQLIERVAAQEAEMYLKAAALLTLVANGSLPQGRCCTLALEAARHWLASPSLRSLMRRSPEIRDQLVQRLLAAEARMAG